MNFWEIYDAYYRPVKSFIAGMLGDTWAAEDLTQETFIKVQENLDSLLDETKLRPWIYRIARNNCLDYFRSRSRRDDSHDDIEQLQVSIQPMAEASLERHQMSECVQDKVYLLPETHRDILILAEVEDLSQQEVADILEISVSNVRVRLHRARQALKEILKRDCFFDYDSRGVMVCVPKDMPGESC